MSGEEEIEVIKAELFSLERDGRKAVGWCELNLLCFIEKIEDGSNTVERSKIIVTGLSDEIGEVEGEAESDFHALIAVRRILERHGFLLGLVGSCKDVYPSSMSLGMGTGRLAYRNALGEQSTGPLFDIFQTHSNPENLATVAEQEQFNETWLDGFRLTEIEQKELQKKIDQHIQKHQYPH